MTDVQDDDVTPLEYLVSGLVVLSFGLLYYLLNHSDSFLSGETDLSVHIPEQTYVAPVDPEHREGLSLYPSNDSTVNAAVNNSAPQVAKASEEQEQIKTLLQRDEVTSNAAAETAEKLKQQVIANQQLGNSLTQQQQQAAQQQAALDDELAQLKAEVDEHKAEIARLKQLETERDQQEEAVEATAKEQDQPGGFENDLQQLMSSQEKNKPITFDKIYFDPGSALLKVESQPQIAALAEQLSQHEDTRILIRGHSDNIGTAQKNSLLSLRRGDSMKKALVELGIDSNRIKIEGVGSLEPIASNDTEEGREKNRRIELIVIE